MFWWWSGLCRRKLDPPFSTRQRRHRRVTLRARSTGQQSGRNALNICILYSRVSWKVEAQPEAPWRRALQKNPQSLASTFLLVLPGFSCLEKTPSVPESCNDGHICIVT